MGFFRAFNALSLCALALLLPDDDGTPKPAIVADLSNFDALLNDSDDEWDATPKKPDPVPEPVAKPEPVRAQPVRKPAGGSGMKAAPAVTAAPPGVNRDRPKPNKPGATAVATPPKPSGAKVPPKTGMRMNNKTPLQVRA